jgi:hypothetical protein
VNVESFVDDALEDSVDGTPYSRTELTLAATRLASWCVVNDVPLDRNEVFADQTIERFVAVGLTDLPDATRGNQRAQLRSLGQCLLAPREREKSRLGGANALAPYSPSEISNLKKWARAQGSEDHRGDAGAILALGLGAGLSAAEIAGVRARDITMDSGGVQVAVSSGRPRRVQLRRECESGLWDHAASRQPDSLLLRPLRKKDNARNFVGNLVSRGSRPERGPQTQRMRATWLVQHMTLATPVRVLVEGAGLDSLEALTRYLQFVPGVDDAASRTALRG